MGKQIRASPLFTHLKCEADAAGPQTRDAACRSFSENGPRAEGHGDEVKDLKHGLPSMSQS